jgi:hypothetical protein
MTIEVINDLRDAIFAIALPTPPAPITRAFMVKNQLQTRFMRTVSEVID